ncbi:hypothetical protein DFH09DRAFT_1319242 [Mycena vulgaris]|nr:hypothetical protein DFH09DRAFT_1319242 [Mycena vulgaris]
MSPFARGALKTAGCAYIDRGAAESMARAARSASPTTGEGARTSAHVSECVLKVSADVPHYFGDFRGPGDGGREQAVSGEEER